MTAYRCSFCTRKSDEVSHLLRAAGSVFICLACARLSVETMEKGGALRISRFPLPTREPPRAQRAPDARHLNGFLYQAGLRGQAIVPGPVWPWVLEFLEVYEGEVLSTVSALAECEDSLMRANHINDAFDRMMEPFRGDRRRAYLGAIFSDHLGRSIRDGFSYHINCMPVAASADVSL